MKKEIEQKTLTVSKNNKLTTELINKFKETPFLSHVIIGLILGSGKLTRSGNITVSYEYKRKGYMQHLYNILKEYITPSGICTYTDEITKRPYLTITTRPIFKELYLEFNKLDNNNIPYKTLPSNIEELLTPEALAYLIMDNGNNDKTKIELLTTSFSFEDVKILANILQTKYKVLPILNSINNSDINTPYTIIISEDSIYKLKYTVGKYIQYPMKYKLGF